jgi:hypothetical protein
VGDTKENKVVEWGEKVKKHNGGGGQIIYLYVCMYVLCSLSLLELVESKMFLRLCTFRLNSLTIL